jgi:hypothetical protein
MPFKFDLCRTVSTKDFIMTPDDYVEWRNRLASVWQRDTSFMSYLSPNDQWDLHGYFQFHREKSEQDVLGHLAAIQADEPDVETRGLAALEHLQAAIDHVVRERQSQPAPSPPVKGGARGRRVVVTGAVVRPEIDVQKLARACIQIAKMQREQEAGVAQPDDGHVRGRCSSTADGSHPDLSAYTSSSNAKTQVNQFLRCCKRATQEVDKQHVTIATAASALAKASEYPAITRQPILKAMAELAVQARDARTKPKALQAWQELTTSLAMMKIPS